MAEKEKGEFLKETLSKDIQEADIAALSKTLDVKESFTTEINPEQQASKIKKRKKIRFKLLFTVLGIFVLLILIVGVFSYFFYAAPFWVSKQPMEKIALTDTLTEDHISYIMNEIGAYKLHDAPLGGTLSQMELFISDTMQKYTITVENRKPVTFLGDASDPDLRINVKEKTIFELYNSGDIIAKAKELVDSGAIEIEQIKDEAVLASKGYKSIYDRISGKKISGTSIFRFSSGVKRMLYFLAVIVICFFGVWYLWKSR